ncbi:hypothetical protein O181_007939 [Austropuccinia psidii MF-1]|uniref:Uncharacterized protein n=1 Tax=Austropuccinia psidii MF-1 TaxID=1389203 RepID=A0A9Q3BLT8_9BASI|nr:hypothetical protein [Austropuccinia psidii MF-1]
MDTNSNTSDMVPQKQFNSPKSSDMECSSSESIIASSTAMSNPPQEFPEGVKCGNTLPPESHVKIGTITNISSKTRFKPSNNKAKKKICQALQLAPEVNERESGAFCPSANERNNGHQINTKNHHPVEVTKIGGVTNHHENIVSSPNLDTQEVTTIPNEKNSTETQRTVSEDEIVLNQMDSAAFSLTLTPSHSCMKSMLENEKKLITF